jgi:hypothetical protein
MNMLENRSPGHDIKDVERREKREERREKIST